MAAGDVTRASTSGMLQVVALLLAAKDGLCAVYVADSLPVAWERLKFAARQMGIEAAFNETHKTVAIPGPIEPGIIRVLGPDDTDKLRGSEIDAAVVDRRTDAINDMIRPRLAARRGWVVYADEAL